MDYQQTTVGKIEAITTTSNCWIDYPYNPGGSAVPFTTGYWHVSTPPVECSGDVHVFPCPHCEKCKCGKATVKKDAKKK
jgi:hypothetical protein